MNEEWQEYMSRKRKRSARKSGDKRSKSDENSNSVSDSFSRTASVIQEANETLDSQINELLDSNLDMPDTPQAGLPGMNMDAAGQPTTLAGLPGTNMIFASQPTPGLNTTSSTTSSMGSMTFTTSYHTSPVSTYTVLGTTSSTGQPTSISTLNGTGAAFGQPLQNPFSALNGPSAFNTSSSNLSHMGVTDGSTALILHEIQSMRAGLVNDLSTQMRIEMQKVHNEIAEGFNKRFKLLEDEVVKLQGEHVKLSQELGKVAVSGSLQGDTLQQVVDTSVQQAISNTSFLTKKHFDYDVTIACPGVIYSADENIEEKAKQLIHVGLNLPDVKVVRAMRTPFQHHINRPGLMKIELESVEVKKRVLAQSGRLQSWQVLGPKVIIRGSQTHDMRTQVRNQVTFLKGTGLDSQFTVNKNGLLQAKPGSQAAANIQASNQMFQGNAYPNNPMYAPRPNNPVYAPRPQSQSNGTSFSYNNNPVYGPPTQPRPSNGHVTNSVYTPSVQPQTYAQAVQTPQTSSNVNPLLQFMPGLR